MKQNILKLFTLLVIAPFFSNAQSYFHATKVQEVGENPYYILPKACLLFEVPVVHKTYIFSKKIPTNYEKDELEFLKDAYGFDPEIYKLFQKRKKDGQDSLTYKTHNVLSDSIKVSALARPDYSKIFFTDGRKRWNKDKSILFTYGGDGMMTDGESSVTDKTFDIVAKAVSGVGQIIGATVRGGNTIVPDSSRVYKEEMIKVIQELDALVGGPSNFDIYKDAKAKLEKKYNRLFSSNFYSEKSRIEVIKIFYVPEDTTITSDTELKLFSLDSISGKLILSNALSHQLWASDQLSGDLHDNAFKIKFTKPLTGLEKFIKPNPNSIGFAYNIPAKLEVKLTAPKEKVIFNDFMKIPQFGTIGRIISDKNKLSFSLDPLTGELRKLGLGSSAITVDQVGAGTTALTELIKYQDAKLDLEIKRLEAEKKKRDLLKELE
ncbi:hypothetical protein [Sphingobacterium sp.]|uniref:hypothetical protein n=1 Tax=Sphingobacterium sp. TaxID=341027 RepID=UPI00289A574D|nr:hypothetical protein [Sphingobacterium sp.]